MKKIFVSVPMSGRTDKEIDQAVKRTIDDYCMKDGPENYVNIRTNTKFINNNDYYTRKCIDPRHAKIPPLVYLGVAISRMANCDDVIFGEGWEKARGCRVEKMIYDLYFNKD